MATPLTVLSGYKPPENRARKREPMLEQQRKLAEPEIRGAFLSVSRRHGESMYQRFQSAKERLERLYDSSIDLVDTHGRGIALVARLEFHTTHRTIDEDLDQLVRTAGFSLTLRSVPMNALPPEERYEQIPGRFIEEQIPLAQGEDAVGGVWLKRRPVYEQKMERLYIITEDKHRSGDIRRAAESAEGLLALASKLRPAIPEDLPEKVADVIPISSARNPRTPEPPLVGAKAS